MIDYLFVLYFLLCIICIILFGILSYNAIEHFREYFSSDCYKKSHLCKAIFYFIYSGGCVYIFIILFNQFKQFI